MDDHEQVDQAIDHQHGLGRLLWLCRRALLSPYAGIIGPSGPIGHLFQRHQGIRACLGHLAARFLARSSRPRCKIGPQNRATVGASTGIGALAARTSERELVRLARLARFLRHRPTQPDPPPAKVLIVPLVSALPTTSSATMRS